MSHDARYDGEHLRCPACPNWSLRVAPEVASTYAALHNGFSNLAENMARIGQQIRESAERRRKVRWLRDQYERGLRTEDQSLIEYGLNSQDNRIRAARAGARVDAARIVRTGMADVIDWLGYDPNAGRP